MSAHTAADEPRDGVVVAIDGPAGSGKSTIARRVADELGLPHLDTGALYRAVTLACLRADVDLADGAACGEVARGAELDRMDGRTRLDGEDVEDEIRGEAVTAAVSEVSAHAEVRDVLAPVQRAMAQRDGAVAEGRDIGTVVFPEADVKIFLDAAVEERARRRAHQLGVAATEELVADLRRRDDHDANRAVAPLSAAPDAVRLDTTGWSVDHTVAVVADVVRAATGGAGADAEGDPPDEASAAADADAPSPPALARPPDPLGVRRSLPVVAVVGRPNVGKSTLVNRILGARVAIVEERPGVTRDRTEHVAQWQGRSFLLVDTGGWQHAAEGLASRVVEQAELAARTADVVLFVVDATVGAQEDDERWARQLRRGGAPVVLVANKVDGPRQEPLVAELYSLGLAAPVAVSARHGRGVGDLLDQVTAAFPAATPDVGEVVVPRIAIVGKPNVGKSSLFNRLLGEDRAIVDPVPHTTRDAIDTLVEIEDRPWVFVDTAGMRRRYRRGEDTELYSVDRTRMAIEQAHVVLFVLDASEPLTDQDQRLASLIRDARRGCVLALNKWDLVGDDRREALGRELERRLSFAAWAPRVNVSAATGRGLRRLLPHLQRVWDHYQVRISTRELNRFLEEATARVPPPSISHGRPLKLRYLTQPETAPPLFVVFGNGRLPAAYRRYLERSLRERFGFEGVPLAIRDRAPQPRSRR